MTSDHQRFLAYGAALADAIDASIEKWVVSVTLERAPHLDREAAAAAVRCRQEVVGRLRALLALDLDRQSVTPLQILRSAAAFPTAVLRSAGVEVARRDELDVRRDPDDVYALAPTSFADLGPEVGDAGTTWGAAKAYVHLARRRESGNGQARGEAP
jgi:hypothetical protein